MRKWWRTRFRKPGDAARPGAAAPFSLRQLALQNASLAEHYLWARCGRFPASARGAFLHLGCGERVLDGFVNLDFIPHDERVFPWNMLDVWPEAMTGTAEGVFSEDLLEHFFHAEQVYILCNVNRVLQPGCVARMLMPSLPRLIDYSTDYAPDADEFLHQSFGIETGADALNIGLRFSGHRWLHSAQSTSQHGRHVADSTSSRRLAPRRPLPSSTASTYATKRIPFPLPRISPGFGRSLARCSRRLPVAGARRVEDVMRTASRSSSQPPTARRSPTP